MAPSLLAKIFEFSLKILLDFLKKSNYCFNFGRIILIFCEVLLYTHFYSKIQGIFWVNFWRNGAVTFGQNFWFGRRKCVRFFFKSICFYNFLPIILIFCQVLLYIPLYLKIQGIFDLSIFGEMAPPVLAKMFELVLKICWTFLKIYLFLQFWFDLPNFWRGAFLCTPLSKNSTDLWFANFCRNGALSFGQNIWIGAQSFRLFCCWKSISHNFGPIGLIVGEVLLQKI